MFKYGNITVGGAFPTVIAEAGVNHLRDKELAKEIIQAAKRAGADVVKFQTYEANKLTTSTAPRFWKWTGEQDANGSQRDSYKKLETADIDFTTYLFETCKAFDIGFMSTPFDLEAAEMLNAIGSHGFKIASGDIVNIPLLKKIGSFGKPVFLSTGAANIEEIKFSIDVLHKSGCADICVMHCTLCYPTRMEDANLSALLELKKHFPSHVLGLSDHTIGVLAPALSVMYGCKVVEKHFTVDKTLPDSADHWLSVDEAELSQLTKSMEAAQRAVGDSSKRMLECEIPTRLNARRSIVVKGFVKKGEKFTVDNITTKRPGTGISARLYEAVLGLTATNDLGDDHMLSHRDIADDTPLKPISENTLDSESYI